ncbi:MalY/PatB family protein [Butyrivibrio sp. MC2013]|uniref:MalY/PatB family protein n=1 Tax=Butyrivibrio sp. MC2013 TaxID=1280686 RepID=UPI0004103D82|nr:MalY/PatB family protein [Butyrivibrio sp. MC2013]
MAKYNFDEIHDRRGTNSIKWDMGPKYMGRDDLLPMWVADMDFKLPDEIIEDIVKSASRGIYGYTDPGEDYIKSLNYWFKTRHGFEVESDWVIVQPGVVFGISIAIRALTEPGDAVMVQQPVYYPFTRTIEQNGRRVVNNELLYTDGGYEIDFEDFEEKIISENVKMFILCSPHNPVGRVWTRDELLKMARICKEHDVYVFADEIHFDFVYSSYTHIPYISLGREFTDRLIIGTSASKTFNMAGLQIANIIIPDPEVREKYRKVNTASGYGQCAITGLYGVMSAYTKGAEWLDEMLEYIEGNLACVRNFLKEKLPKVHLVEPEGTYLIWLDFTELVQDHKELEKLIVDKAHLWLDPGSIFGSRSSLFERVNIACPRLTIVQAMDQLYEAVRSYCDDTM